MGGEALHRRDQEAPGVGFQQETLGAGFQDLAHQGGGVVHGEDQDFGARNAGADLAGGLDPVHHRQRVVEHDDVRTGGQRLIDRFLAVPASPTTSQPACASRIARTPDRTTSWSSAIRMRVIARSLGTA